MKNMFPYIMIFFGVICIGMSVLLKVETPAPVATPVSDPTIIHVTPSVVSTTVTSMTTTECLQALTTSAKFFTTPGREDYLTKFTPLCFKKD